MPSLQRFAVITLLVSIWVNVSEVFRYFAIVMPAMRRDLAAIPNVAPMNWPVFAVWGVWDTILAAFVVFLTLFLLPDTGTQNGPHCWLAHSRGWGSSSCSGSACTICV
ncbi:MAG: hypothetical protein GXP26_14285 [Planctomycetes bacterium]|nr:hypothetical protein [Planctomycetota bacterium]